MVSSLYLTSLICAFPLHIKSKVARSIRLHALPFLKIYSLLSHEDKWRALISKLVLALIRIMSKWVPTPQCFLRPTYKDLFATLQSNVSSKER